MPGTGVFVTYCGQDEKCPHGLRHLSSWFPGGSAALEGLG